MRHRFTTIAQLNNMKIQIFRVYHEFRLQKYKKISEQQNNWRLFSNFFQKKERAFAPNNSVEAPPPPPIPLKSEKRTHTAKQRNINYKRTLNKNIFLFSLI